MTLEASAIRESKAHVTSAPTDTQALLTALVRQFQRQQYPVSVNFRQLLPALNGTDRYTHLLHPYPAKLLVHIPYLFLSNELLSVPGDAVLDPFCGSGTVLLEAQLAGRRAYGVDPNPLARLIAQVKTSPLDSDALTKTLENILERVAEEPSGSCPDVVNLEHWFYPAAIKQLRCLEEVVNRLRIPEIRNFFMACLSVCVRRVSLADPRLSVPVRLKLGIYPENHPFREQSDKHLRQLRRVNVRGVFARIARINIARMHRFQGLSNSLGSAEILCSDARRLVHEYSPNGQHGTRFDAGSIQLIITSPPYPGAQKYVRASSLSLGWLRLCRVADLRGLQAKIIGREEFTSDECNEVLITEIAEADEVLAAIRGRSPIRAAIAATYLREMHVAIREMHRVLRDSGYVVLVAANNRISGMEFRTADFLRAMAEQCGFTTVAIFVDAIKSRGLMTKRNSTASVISRETVLIFAKGKLPKWTL